MGKSRIKNFNPSAAVVKRKRASNQLDSLFLVFTVTKNNARTNTRKIPIKAAISLKVKLSIFVNQYLYTILFRLVCRGGKYKILIYINLVFYFKLMNMDLFEIKTSSDYFDEVFIYIYNMFDLITS
ncbi:hypothetical protein GCM10010984_18870 [Chishuiella changwenlii]|uniref:Uncharacterized protein n=1 Tax=Chishuiella changwenlii TaxID=1434701 RepID=A0ABQ1TRK3_9FLAO|nr:hypothetical protein [Chishuiella changwenlii]GGF01677.1 hypothetical protein GCM10010984_18870 [Chishuiella changwenlii]